MGRIPISNEIYLSELHPWRGLGRPTSVLEVHHSTTHLMGCQTADLHRRTSKATAFARFQQAAVNKKDKLSLIAAPPFGPPPKYNKAVQCRIARQAKAKGRGGPIPKECGEDPDLSESQSELKKTYEEGKTLEEPTEPEFTTKDAAVCKVLLRKGKQGTGDTAKDAQIMMHLQRACPKSYVDKMSKAIEEDDKRDAEEIKNTFDEISKQAMEAKEAGKEVLKEPVLTEEEKWEAEDEEAVMNRENADAQATDKYLAGVRKLKELMAYADVEPEDNVDYGQIWSWGIDVLKRRSRQAAQIADNAVLEAWRQQRVARDYSHEAMVAEAAAMRSMPVSPSPRMGGQFDYKLTPEQFAMYGDPRPSPGTELPVTPLVVGSSREMVRIREDLSEAPFLPAEWAAVSAVVAVIRDSDCDRHANRCAQYWDMECSTRSADSLAEDAMNYNKREWPRSRRRLASCDPATAIAFL